MIRVVRRTCVLCLGALLVACDNQVPATPNVLMTIPDAIGRVRAVDKENVSPLVLLDGTIEIPMRAADGRDGFTGTIPVSPNTTYELSVIWQEFFPNRQEDQYLELARVDKSITTNAEGTTVENIGNNEYRFDMDFDGDGVSNLDERRNETNPFDPNNAGGDGTGDPQADAGTTDNSDGNSTGGNTEAGTTDSGSTTGTTDIDAGSDGDGSTSNSDGSSTQGSDGNSSAGTDGNNSDGSDQGTSSGNDGDSTDGGTTDASDGGSTTSGSGSETVIIPRIASGSAPSIDGLGLEFLGENGELVGEWANAVQFDLNGAPLHINNLMIDNGAEAPDGTPYRRWAAMHDGERLYILALVDDDGYIFADSNLAYQDDSLEIFIDGDNSKQTEYDGNDDFHVIIPLLKFGSEDSNNQQDGRIMVGQFSSTEPFDLIFTTGPGIGPDGIRREIYEQDVYEVSIDLADAGIVPGLEFGLELQVNDDDDGANRDSKWGWFHPSRGNQDTDQTWMNPSIMGTVVLEE